MDRAMDEEEHGLAVEIERQARRLSAELEMERGRSKQLRWLSALLGALLSVSLISMAIERQAQRERLEEVIDIAERYRTNAREAAELAREAIDFLKQASDGADAAAAE